MSTTKKYVINLDLPAKDRWTQVFADHKEACAKAVVHLNQMTTSSMMGSFVTYAAESIVSIYVRTRQAMYLDEIKAAALLMGISVERAILFQLVYEMSAMCTSLGCSVEGYLVHYRTMDWDMEFLKDLTVSLEFQRSGKTLFHAVSWVGYVGVLTAMIPKKMSLSINFREEGGSLVQNLYRLMALKYPIGYLVRELLENHSEDLTYIVSNLKHAELVAPCYITVCDARSQLVTVYTRSRNGCVLEISDYPYHYQTNIDHTERGSMAKNDPRNCLLSVERCEYLSKQMGEFQQENLKDKNVMTLIDRLSHYPVINQETIYVTVMIPEKSVIHTVVVPRSSKN